MKLTNALLNFSVLLIGLVIASTPDTNTLTPQRPSTKPAVLINKQYPDSHYTRTPNTPQTFCGDTKYLMVVTNNIDHNVTIQNCVALSDMYAINSTANGNGYWNFTFDASDRNDTSGLPQFTVDFDGDCELKMGLVDYSGVPLNVKIGNLDIYNLINVAIGGGNFSKATGQVGCDDVQVIWAVEWIPGAIGHKMSAEYSIEWKQ